MALTTRARTSELIDKSGAVAGGVALQAVDKAGGKIATFDSSTLSISRSLSVDEVPSSDAAVPVASTQCGTKQSVHGEGPDKDIPTTPAPMETTVIAEF